MLLCKISNKISFSVGAQRRVGEGMVGCMCKNCVLYKRLYETMFPSFHIQNSKSCYKKLSMLKCFKSLELKKHKHKYV